jgi:multiple sugar transport system permease protein
MVEGKEIYIGFGDLNWKRRPGQASRVVVTYLLLAFGAFVFLLPLFWLISTALKSQPEVYVFPPEFFPKSFLWQNFIKAWTYPKTNFPLWTLNTLFITFLNVIAQVFAAAWVAYGFARIKFPGRDIWFMLVLASIMLPGAVVLIPLFVLYSKIGWLDTFAPLTVPVFFGGGAFNIFLLRQFFKSIPIELEEAAIIDGANRFRILLQIVLPLSKPVLATVAVFAFQGVWNDFYGPLIYLSSVDHYTLALGVNSFKGLYSTEIPLMMAVSTMMVVPMIIVFFFAQKQMIRGVILSGIKA